MRILLDELVRYVSVAMSTNTESFCGELYDRDIPWNFTVKRIGDYRVLVKISLPEFVDNIYLVNARSARIILDELGELARIRWPTISFHNVETNEESVVVTLVRN